MIPNMYKIAGELLPSVIPRFRSCACKHTHFLFSATTADIYACRQTGFAMLCSTNPQEVMDLGAVAHLSTITRQEFPSFTSSTVSEHLTKFQKIEVWDYEDTRQRCSTTDAVRRFQKQSSQSREPRSARYSSEPRHLLPGKRSMQQVL